MSFEISHFNLPRVFREGSDILRALLKSKAITMSSHEKGIRCGGVLGATEGIFQGCLTRPVSIDAGLRQVRLQSV